MRHTILVALVVLINIVGCANKANETVDTYTIFRYKGAPHDWDVFLSCWEKETINKLEKQNELLSKLQEDVMIKKTQKYKPATVIEIETTEKRLNTKLPQSYKDFLSVTNGWIQIDMDAEDGRILPVEQIDFTKNLYAELGKGWYKGIVSDKDYFNYSKTQDAALIRGQFIDNSLAISDVVDSGVYLLNPNVVDDDGEWEAWFLGWHLPGAIRFNTFAGLMRYAYYKSIHTPDYDGIYLEELLGNTCAKYLPVEEYIKIQKS